MTQVSQENLPKIIKTIFVLDKNRRYSFDVNQNIIIRNLKKMIDAAANLGRAHIRLFHDGQEYTSNDEDSLEFLFPTLEVSVFDLAISVDSIDVYDDFISLKLNEKYCPLHYSKYPYFYCYTCGKSICSECLFSNAHQGHNYKEKYDYLQSGQELVSLLFKDLNDNIKSADDKFILELKDKIRIQFFSKLKKMVEEIEKRLVEVLDEFIKRNRKNIEAVKNNMISLRKNCGEGLDELKDKICIEDMMIDEEIFLTFDKKFKDIESEKNKIMKDIEEYNQFKQQLKVISDAVDKIYQEIYSFLEKYLTSDIFMKIIKEIEKIDILPLSKKDIFYRILSDVKKKPKIYKSRKKIRKSNLGDEDQIMEEYNPGKNNITSPLYNNTNTNTNQIDNTSSRKNNTEIIYRNLNESNSFVLESKYVCQPIEKTNKILVYDVNSQKVYTQQFENILLSEIPVSCAWVNYKNCLYISGGEINGKISKNLIKYDPEKNNFEILPQIPDNKEFHSMCFDDKDNIYLIGGLNNTVLKYNLNNQKWTIFKNKLVAQRNHPICLVKDNDLYIFFGSDIYGGYVSSYEKTSLGGKGNFIMYNPEPNINLEFASTFETVENSILFFGGRNGNGPLKTCWKFNPNNQKFEISPYTLSEPSSFHQCFLSEIGNNCFGYFSLESKNFVKINFNYKTN